MPYTSARLAKEAPVGKADGAGQSAAGTKNQALHATGLKCGFPYLEGGTGKKKIQQVTNF